MALSFTNSPGNAQENMQILQALQQRRLAENPDLQGLLEQLLRQFLKPRMERRTTSSGMGTGYGFEHTGPADVPTIAPESMAGAQFLSQLLNSGRNANLAAEDINLRRDQFKDTNQLQRDLQDAQLKQQMEVLKKNLTQTSNLTHDQLATQLEIARLNSQRELKMDIKRIQDMIMKLRATGTQEDQDRAEKLQTYLDQLMEQANMLPTDIGTDMPMPAPAPTPASSRPGSQTTGPPEDVANQLPLLLRLLSSWST